MNSRSDTNTHTCTFCNAPEGEVRKLIRGPDCFICDTCVDTFASYLFVTTGTTTISARVETNPSARCSFCAKLKSEVKQLLSCSNATICDECVNLCMVIVDMSLERPINPDIQLSAAMEKLRSCSAHRTYARLAISARHEQEFVDRWQKQFAAALALDGLVKITFVPGVTLGERTGWHVVGEWRSPPSKLGDAAKLITNRMLEAGVLLRSPNWHLAEGITYAGNDRSDLLY